MRPRPIGRGNTTTPRSLPSVSWRFNEAATDWSRKCHSDRDETRYTHRFNEAATDWSRKFPSGTAMPNALYELQ